MQLGALRSIGSRVLALDPLLIGTPLIVIACVAVFGSTLSYGFTGVDVLPLILSNRVESPSDFLSIFTDGSLGAYRGQDIAAPPSSRPVGQLLFAADYWLWGLDPLGYHLTNFAIHVANALLIILLVRQLRLGQWHLIGLLAAIIFAIHPLHTTVLPSLETRYDLLLGTFTILSLVWVLKYLESNKLRYLSLAALSGVLAFGSKETALLLVPMVAVTALWVRAEGRKGLGAVLALLGTWVFIAAGYLIYRWLVVGEPLGGYPTKAIDYDFIWRLTLQEFLNPLLHFVAHSYGGPLQRLVIRIDLAVGLLLLLIAVSGLLYYGLRRQELLSRFMAQRVGPDWKPDTLLTCWLLIFLFFYIAASLRTGVFQSWYLYVPTVFFAVLLSTATFHLVRLFAESLAKPKKSALVFSVASMATLPVVLIFSSYGLALSGSTQLTAWSDSSTLGGRYLKEVQNTVSTLPDGATIFLINLPHGVQCPDAPCIDRAYMFEDYSVDSWIRLVMPERDFRFIAVSTIWLNPGEDAPVSQFSYDGAASLITVVNTGGMVEPPWRTRSGGYLEINIERSQAPRVLTARVIDEAILQSGSHYFFDYFEPRKIMALGREGLVQGNEGQITGRNSLMIK